MVKSMGNGYKGPPRWIDRLTDTYDWKQCLPATSLVGGNKLTLNEAAKTGELVESTFLVAL